ncbi:MAG: LysR family transcriptional regulator [Peptococcaceae bacterium]|nr:LysR family transcriptional regulator [Peptococcaceae bacterium]
MQLDWLNYFIEIIHAGTISAAAQNLHISQPALSKTIKKLENELGQPLLKRTNHGIYPTSLGQKVYNEFQQIQQTMQGWYIQPQMPEPEGQVHVCCIACASNYVLNEIITPFRQQYPKVDIVLHDLRVQTVIHSLKNTPANIAITSLPTEPNNKLLLQAEALGWMIYHLFTDERRILVGTSHPLANKESLTLLDLKSLPLAYYSTEQDLTSTIYEPYFSHSYKVATRENIMELVINNTAAFMPIFNLMKNDFYVKQRLVKSFTIPIPEIDSRVPVVAITTDSLTSCECLFRDALLHHFSEKSL